MNFLIISWFSQLFGISVLYLMVDTLNSATVSEGLLEIVSGQELLLEQGLKDSELEQMTKSHLRLVCLVL